VKNAETERLHSLLHFERQARSEGFVNIAGVDEAGRGPLAGPVFAAACIIPEGITFPGIDDSKKLTPAKRDDLYEKITSTPGVIYGIGSVSSEKVDEVNIYQATMLAMQEALSKLGIDPDYILVDGLQLAYGAVPALKIIGGDGKSQSIAAASVIAKVSRDRAMDEYHKKWPRYGFNKHKGYGTSQHLDAIAKYGPCPIHRLTFAPLMTFCVNRLGF
jgi:ribonuclease HII